MHNLCYKKFNGFLNGIFVKKIKNISFFLFLFVKINCCIKKRTKILILSYKVNYKKIINLKYNNWLKFF